MKTFTATFKSQLFPWSEPYNTTRTIEAKDKFEAMQIAEEYATKKTRVFKTQGGGESFIGKLTILTVK